MPKDKIIEEFDKKFPAFEGTGAMFPIFKDAPNREHIRNFLIKSLSIQKQKIVEEIEKTFREEYKNYWNVAMDKKFNICLNQLKQKLNK